ncbi:hypothetical protein [Psychrobacter pacificensis]|uniref:hypothetical protein n=1 Tax=Psychrobacter pacificensis TaxID=112002 RepID=UPI001CBD2A29|nr:hypothetical protein [Psychrobacter pacificensis]MBZ1392820.1 hypothetical protein [Psychrobacter pacificensis]|tara:strand:+ start:9475 stop:9651 length:177 start_codon:yes stop_codon:yes gene_type:complete
MTLDNTDYKIILDALYVLATDDEVDISQEVLELGAERERRLLLLREHFSKLEHKSRHT